MIEDCFCNFLNFLHPIPPDFDCFYLFSLFNQNIESPRENKTQCTRWEQSTSFRKFKLFACSSLGEPLVSSKKTFSSYDEMQTAPRVDDWIPLTQTFKPSSCVVPPLSGIKSFQISVYGATVPSRVFWKPHLLLPLPLLRSSFPEPLPSLSRTFFPVLQQQYVWEASCRNLYNPM